MFHVEGEIARSHAEGDVRVIDELRITSVSYSARECFCQSCGDDCITVTASEYCADCEIAYCGRNTRPCH